MQISLLTMITVKKFIDTAVYPMLMKRSVMHLKGPYPETWQHRSQSCRASILA